MRTDLKNLPEGSLVWFGHSAFLMRLAGKNILVDPTLSSNAAPVWFIGRAFPGTTSYLPEDLPDIDVLIISHDHWDHLDYPTVSFLRERTRTVVMPLGVGAHFERWGYPAGSLREGDWWDGFELAGGITVTLIPARHFSGRALKWNQSLWAGFMIEGGGRKIFYSGDGGFMPQYAEFGERTGPPDLAIIECGQYDRRWKDIHMTPEEVAEAARLMGAKAVMPVHSGKFSIANHTWDDPFIRFARAAGRIGINPVTPIFGQPVDLGSPETRYPEWWTTVE
jgi:L-ascorbate metabolism protein UlaG (beta-lactamase superfamily)